MRPSSIDPAKIMEIIEDVAAQTIEPRFQALAAHEISTKTSPSDLVTVADIEAEEALERYLPDLLPGSIAIGEEAVSKGTKSLDQLLDDGTYWVIDPVDGTHNFAHGKPVFGTMVALLDKGQTIQSWILDIPGKRKAMAEKGSGTTLNGAQINIPDTDRPLPEISGYISTRFAPQAIRKEVEEKREQLGSIEALFCCAHEYLNILEGESKYAVYTRTKPWDHLPGSLLLDEAGAYVRKWDETPYSPKETLGGILAATDQNLWRTVYDLFLNKYVEDKNIFS